MGPKAPPRAADRGAQPGRSRRERGPQRRCAVLSPPWCGQAVFIRQSRAFNLAALRSPLDRGERKNAPQRSRPDRCERKNAPQRAQPVCGRWKNVQQRSPPDCGGLKNVLWSSQPDRGRRKNVLWSSGPDCGRRKNVLWSARPGRRAFVFPAARAANNFSKKERNTRWVGPMTGHGKQSSGP